MPELEATAPAIRATRSSRLDGAAAAGRTMVRSTSAAVAGFVSTIDIAGRTSRVLLLSLIPRARGAAAIQFGGERWSSGVRSERSCRPPRRRARAGRQGVIANSPDRIRTARAPCASSLSHFSRQIRRQQTDPHPPPRRAAAGSERHGGGAPHARAGATAPAIRATRSSRLDGAAAAGRTMVRSTSAAVAGFVSTIDIAGRTSRVLLLSLIPRAQSSSGANAGARAFGANDHAGRRGAGRALDLSNKRKQGDC